MATVRTTAAMVPSSPAVPFDFAGCYFKEPSLAIKGYEISWPSLTPHYCAYACSHSQYFWLESGMSFPDPTVMATAEMLQTPGASAWTSCRPSSRSNFSTAITIARGISASPATRRSIFDSLSWRTPRNRHRHRRRRVLLRREVTLAARKSWKATSQR